jgi:hypothetical protein
VGHSKTRKEEAMPDDETAGPRREVQIEERGVLTDAIIPLAQAGVGGAVGAVVSNHLSKPKDPLPPPPPPPPADSE